MTTTTMNPTMMRREAASDWVERSLIPIPMHVIEKLGEYSDYYDMCEITPRTAGMYVRIDTRGTDNYETLNGESVCTDDLPNTGEIVQYLGDEMYLVQPDSPYNGDPICCADDQIEPTEGYYGLPAWGTMWAFKYSTDSDWVREHLHETADCGFRIYESEDFGCMIGIDGGGYDFYESHWIPLHRARGFQLFH